MKKESVFVAVLLVSVTLAFALGIKYQQNSVLTGETIFEKQIDPIEKSVSQIRDSIKELKNNMSEFNNYLIGGGSESVFNETNSTYAECISWGESSCQNNKIKCPEEYEKFVTSIHNKSMSDSPEKTIYTYLCIKSETINKTKRRINFDNEFRDSIFYQ